MVTAGMAETLELSDDQVDLGPQPKATHLDSSETGGIRPEAGEFVLFPLFPKICSDRDLPTNHSWPGGTQLVVLASRWRPMAVGFAPLRSPAVPERPLPLRGTRRVWSLFYRSSILSRVFARCYNRVNTFF